MDNNIKSSVSSPSFLERDLGRGCRIRSLDLARGFTVFIMLSIHVCMMYSTPEVQQSFLGTLLTFIAEGPGAQLFMMVMGIAFVLSPQKSGKEVCKRSILLLFAAYALNFVKFVMPYGLGLVPQNLVDELALSSGADALRFFISFGDILHFAAMAYPVLWLITRLPWFQYFTWILAALIALISPLLWDIHTGIDGIDYVLTLLGGHPPSAFFPVFPWLVYPLMGLGIGYQLKSGSVPQVMNRLRWWGFMIILVTVSFPATKPSGDWLPFYRTGPVDTLFHTGLVMLWVGLTDWCTRRVRDNYGFTFLQYCSKNITIIYILQWILICWGMAVAGYMQLGMKATLYAMLMVTTTTLFFTWLIRKAHGK